MAAMASGISYASAVSIDGSVVVGSDGNGESFRWTQSDGLQVLKNAGQTMNADAIAVSADGSTVVGQDFDLNTAFIWDQFTESEAFPTYSPPAASIWPALFCLLQAASPPMERLSQDWR